jgi:hypothetical protein
MIHFPNSLNPYLSEIETNQKKTVRNYGYVGKNDGKTNRDFAYLDYKKILHNK